MKPILKPVLTGLLLLAGGAALAAEPAKIAFADTGNTGRSEPPKRWRIS